MNVLFKTALVVSSTVFALARTGAFGYNMVDVIDKPYMRYYNIKRYNLGIVDYYRYTAHDLDETTASCAPHLVLEDRWNVSVMPTVFSRGR